MCFNPRTHEGCDGLIHNERNQVEVSIHAPTRGATCPIVICSPLRLVFQSTHPRGVRLYVSSRAAAAAHVSIHAPTRGATRLQKVRLKSKIRFQSTHPRGVRHRFLKELLTDTSFNPRTHEGCDLSKSLNSVSLMFQSTHPRGVRPYDDGTNQRHYVFQSTHPRGVRHRMILQTEHDNLFQSTHPRGVRQLSTLLR